MHNFFNHINTRLGMAELANIFTWNYSFELRGECAKV